MKKISLVTAAAVLVLASIAFAVNTFLGITSVSTIAGANNVSVPVTLNNTQSVAIFEFIVNHSSNIKFNGIEPTSRMPNATIEWNNLSSTQVKVSAFVPAEIQAGNGAIMNLKFDVDLLAIPGIYDVKVGNELFVNVNETLSLDLSNGQFTIL